MTSDTRITNNVYASKEKRVFIIYIDGNVVGYCNNEENVKLHLEEIADQLEQELQREAPSARVFRENKGHAIRISRQRSGVMLDGSVKLKHTLRYESIPHYYRPKLELTT